MLTLLFRQYFFEQSLKQAESGEVAQMRSKLEEEEHARLMEENRLENETIAQIREERLKLEGEKTQQKVMATLIKKEQEDRIFEAKMETFIQQQKVNFGTK